MTDREEIIKALDYLESVYEPTALGSDTGNPFQSLISTILSQRTRDENTSEAAGTLFAEFGTPEELARAPVDDIAHLIKKAGFYNQKAENIKRVSGIILEKHGGEVPDDMDELCELPGVGRKTAGCVLVYGFGKPAIPVDTHVHRISNRLGWVNTGGPEETERKLMEIVPNDCWIKVNDLMVSHGKNLCRPINPKCRECGLNRMCSTGKENVDG